MTKVRWRKKALDDLEKLDQWRDEELGLAPIGPALLLLVEDYFANVNLGSYLPGAPVVADDLTMNMRLLLLSVGRSEPYKVFYQPIPTEHFAEVRRIRHPRQKPLKRI